MQSLDVVIIYNQPQLPDDHPDAASERGVLDAVAGIKQGLTAGGHRPRRLGIGSSPGRLLDEIRQVLPCDVVFNLCEGLGGVGQGEAQVTGLLELLGVPITGSGADCLALVRHKARTKWLLAGAKLPTPEFRLIEPGESVARAGCQQLLEKGPVIVKPAHEDASLGITSESVVTEVDALLEQVENVRARYGPVLVEQYIPGREFNVGVVALPEPTPLPLAEIVFRPQGQSPWSLVTYDAKWDAGSQADLATQPRCPAEVEPTLADRIRQVALGAFQVTGCRDYARIDLRVDSQNQIFILEVNGNPDISPGAGLARAIAAHGLDYGEFVCALVEQAYRRLASLTAAPPAVPARSVTTPPQPASTRCAIRDLRDADLPQLVAILRACAVFRPDEVSVGEEVLRESLSKPSADDYKVFVAESEGRLIGWSCHGRVPMTDATYDLYWIAVDPSCQTSGVGRQLVERVIESLGPVGARWLLAETSGSAGYAGTRRFYERVGFDVLSEIPDFYRRRDGRVIFGKRLD